MYRLYYIFILLIYTIFFTNINILNADTALGQKLSGYILLQVESNGEAWYINPTDNQRYNLMRPSDAFSIMRAFSSGIVKEDLNKIPVGLMDYNDNDNDSDGLTNRFEEAIGTDPENNDSDGDGFEDKVELEAEYNPNGTGKLVLDLNFANLQKGNVFLAVDNNGEAWYVNPADSKRYYLGRPDDAYRIMQLISLGITNDNLEGINIGTFEKPSPIPPPICQDCTPDQVYKAAAAAIRTDKKEDVLKYFLPAMHPALEHVMDFFSTEQKFNLGNIMAGAKLNESGDTKKTYSTKIYFSLADTDVPLNFNVEKQTDGTWRLTNL